MSSLPAIGSGIPDVQVSTFVPDQQLTLLIDSRAALAPLLVLPHTLDEGGGVYLDEDVSMVKTLRQQGVMADFLHPKGQRTFRSEYSADAAVDLLMFVGQTLGAMTIEGLVTYLWHRVRRTTPSPPAPVPAPTPISVEIASFVQDGARRELRGVRIVGDAEQVSAALRQVLQAQIPSSQES